MQCKNMNQLESTLENGFCRHLCRLLFRTTVNCIAFSLRIGFLLVMWLSYFIFFPYCYFCRRFIIMSLLTVVCLFYLWLPIASNFDLFLVAFISEVCSTTLLVLPIPLMSMLGLFIYFSSSFSFSATVAIASKCSFTSRLLERVISLLLLKKCFSYYFIHSQYFNSPDRMFIV